MEGKDILDNLTKQMECYRDLLHLARKKREILVEGQVRELDKILAAEQALVLQAGQLEEKRQTLLADMPAPPGVETGALTLEGIMAQLPEGDQPRARELAESLGEILVELEEENRLNQELIQQSLDFIQFSLGVLSETRSSLLDEKA